MNYDNNDFSCPECGSHDTRKLESTSDLSTNVRSRGQSVFSASIICAGIGYAFFDMTNVFLLQVFGVGMLILGVVSFLSAMFGGNLSKGYDVYVCKRCGHQFKKHYSASEKVSSVPVFFEKITSKIREWPAKFAKGETPNEVDKLYEFNRKICRYLCYFLEFAYALAFAGYVVDIFQSKFAVIISLVISIFIFKIINNKIKDAIYRMYFLIFLLLVVAFIFMPSKK